MLSLHQRRHASGVPDASILAVDTTSRTTLSRDVIAYDLEEHWLAGLLEGEGTFLHPPPSAPTQPAVVVQMYDRDVVDHVRVVMRSSALYGWVPKKRPNTVVWFTRLKGGRAVELMERMRPLLGDRRQRQIDRALDLNTSVARGSEPTRTAEPDGSTSLHWLAGLLEGEGTFQAPPPSSPNYPVLSVEMSDRDVIERAARILGERPVHANAPGRAGWSWTYRTDIGGEAAVLKMRELRPFMGERRTSQLDRACAGYRGRLRLRNPPTICVVPGCTRMHRSRGLCNTHYMSWCRDRAAGKPAKITPLR